MKQIIIDGIQDYYFITEDGRVFSNFSGELKLRKIEIDKDGYEKVVLSCGKKNNAKKFFVHRLVALTYIPNPLQHPVVNHLDGKKSNNHVSNLEWTTIQKNCQHAVANNLIKFKSNQDHYQSYITNEIVESIYKDYLYNGMTNFEATKKYNISRSVAQSIRNKRSYRSILENYPDVGPANPPLTKECVQIICSMFAKYKDKPASFIQKRMSDLGYTVTLSRINKIRSRKSYTTITANFSW